MTKRFYQSLISYRYSFGLTLPAILIFVLAFIRNDKNISKVRPLMIILTIILAIMTFLYYKKKFACAKVFKNIQNPDEYYEHGGMAHHSMFLEDRMLVCENLQVTERPVTGIERIAYADGKHDLIEMSNIIKIPAYELISIKNKLMENDLLVNLDECNNPESIH